MPFKDEFFRYSSGLYDSNGALDLDWMKTGVYVGYWWDFHGGSHVGNGYPEACPNIYMRAAADASTPVTGCIITEEGKALMDYANGLNAIGMLVEGWNRGGWDESRTTNKAWTQWREPWRWIDDHPRIGSNTVGEVAFDVDEIVTYGRSLDPPVEYILHLESRNNRDRYDAEIQDASNPLFDYYRTEWGLHYGKGGYVDGLSASHYGGLVTDHFLRVMEEGAKNQIAFNHHEGPKPTGEERTFPNMMTREVIWGGEKAGVRNSQQGIPPGHPTVASFTRMLGGPTDYTPGIIIRSHTGSPPESKSTSMNLSDTAARQLSLMVLLHSPLVMFAETRIRAVTHPNWTEIQSFVKKITPCDWTELRVLKIEPFTTTNNRSGDTVLARRQKYTGRWFIAGVSGGNANGNSGASSSTYSLDLGPFMEAGKTYTFELIKDASNTGGANRINIAHSELAHSELSDPISITMNNYGGFIGVLEETR